MSAVGTTLLQSPICNPGYTQRKKMSSVGAALTERVLVLHYGLCRPFGAQ